MIGNSNIHQFSESQRSSLREFQQSRIGIPILRIGNWNLKLPGSMSVAALGETTLAPGSLTPGFKHSLQPAEQTPLAPLPPR